MIYVFENPDNNASIVFDETTLSENNKNKGIAIEQLPIAEEIEGKVAVLKCRKSTGEVWWEYEDIIIEPTPLETKVNLIQAALDELILGGGAL